MHKSYSELKKLRTIRERYEYCRIGGTIGEDTFGYERKLNQMLYTSRKWRDLRNQIILRDNGCDLGVAGYDVRDKIIIHHLNPITLKDVLEMSDCIFDPDNLICVSSRTHNAIHFGDENLLPPEPVERFPNDTCPWKL